MGKRLIVPGADFYNNRVAQSEVYEKGWFITEYSKFKSLITTATANVVNGGWAFGDSANSLIRGKRINSIKFRPSSSGTLNLYKGNLGEAGELIASISITSDEVGVEVIKNFSPVDIGLSEYLIIGEANSQVGFYFYSASADSAMDGYSFYSKAQSSSHTTANRSSLCFDVGYQL